ncbi:unnamed protein product [Amoebophrya sp. A25]|nr:unnamed protein product [Amoebophrya sp. A25]|eukprot:GSA25T00001415001.1
MFPAPRDAVPFKNVSELISDPFVRKKSGIKQSRRQFRCTDLGNIYYLDLCLSLVVYVSQRGLAPCSTKIFCRVECELYYLSTYLSQWSLGCVRT